ncbi:hypothetical protein IID19_01505 [Patescibacteria group bacterium]|nr:hypothetical protein [Patescibacteria group bacterium]
MLFIFNKILPYLSGVLVGITFEIWSIRPELTYYIGPVLALIIISSIWMLTGRRIFRKTFWNFLSTPLLHIVSSFVFFLLIDNLVIRQLFIIGTAILVALTLYNIFSFLHQTERYQPYALENIYSYVNLISLYLFYVSFYGITILLGWPFWFFLPLIFFLTSFLFMRTLWSFKIPWQKSKLFIAIIGLVLVEASYIIYSLPTSYVFNALLLIVIYYVMMNIIKDHLKGIISTANVKKYILISLVVVTTAVATTKWT